MSDAVLSQVAARIIPCGNSTVRRRFALEYLDINHKEYEKISHDPREQCEEIVFQCLSRWRQKQIDRGNMVSVNSLVELISHVWTQEADWFSEESYRFLQCYERYGKKQKLATWDI